MTDTIAPPPATPAPPLPASNVTRANITGKVPDAAKPHRGRSGRGGKRARLSGDKRKHASQLIKGGIISSTAAAKSGL